MQFRRPAENGTKQNGCLPAQFSGNQRSGSKRSGSGKWFGSVCTALQLMIAVEPLGT